MHDSNVRPLSTEFKSRVLVLADPGPALDHLGLALTKEFDWLQKAGLTPQDDLGALRADLVILQADDPNAQAHFLAMRTLHEFRDIPFVFVMMGNDESIEEALFNQGAADVLRIPCGSRLARARLVACLRTYNRMRRLAAMANVDPATRFPSKRSFTGQLKREHNRAMRLQKCLSVVIFQIQGIEPSGDLDDREFAERCLCHCARSIDHSLQRPTDFACRYLSDKIVLVLPDTDESGAGKVGARMCSAINRSLLELSPNTGSLHAECQVFSTVPERGSSTTEIIRSALGGAGRVINAGGQFIPDIRATAV